MQYTDGTARAQRAARRMLKFYGAEARHHVPVEAFAAHLEVPILVAPLEGARSQLLTADGRAKILISDRLSSPRMQRYAIAHELGHHVLRHPCPPVASLCSPSRTAHEMAHEDEADAFAQELLMPLAPVASWCEGRQMSLVPVGELVTLRNLSTSLRHRHASV